MGPMRHCARDETYTHTHTLFHSPSLCSQCLFVLYSLIYPRYIFTIFKIVISLSTQLVRFLRGASLSEVVFASKSSFSLLFIETYPNVLGAHPIFGCVYFYTHTHTHTH